MQLPIAIQGKAIPSNCSEDTSRSSWNRQPTIGSAHMYKISPKRMPIAPLKNADTQRIRLLFPSAPFAHSSAVNREMVVVKPEEGDRPGQHVQRHNKLI